MATFRITGGALTGVLMSSNYPDNTLPGIEGPVDPGYGIDAGLRPTHPIVIPPDAIAPGVPTHPIYLPVYPSHPIVIPPGSLAPGVPTHPIYLPVYPSHPIVIPPDAVGPGQPEHPIVLPPLGMWGPTRSPTHATDRDPARGDCAGTGRDGPCGGLLPGAAGDVYGGDAGAHGADRARAEGIATGGASLCCAGAAAGVGGVWSQLQELRGVYRDPGADDDHADLPAAWVRGHRDDAGRHDDGA